MTRLKGILFDYGHTLVWFPWYEKCHLIASRNVCRILKKHGVSVEASKVRVLVETFAHRTNDVVPSMEEEFKEIFSVLGLENYSQDDLKEIIEAWWRPYVQKVHVRKGVGELLEYLKMLKFKAGIVANIWSEGMNPVLERLGIAEFFDTTVASIDVGFQKPDPRIFDLALERLRLAPEQAIMVGDNPRTDIKSAHDLGMVTVRLIRGPNRTKPDLVEPDFKIRNLSTLASIVNRVKNYPMLPLKF